MRTELVLMIFDFATVESYTWKINSFESIEPHLVSVR